MVLALELLCDILMVVAERRSNENTVCIRLDCMLLSECRESWTGGWGYHLKSISDSNSLVCIEVSTVWGHPKYLMLLSMSDKSTDEVEDTIWAANEW